MHDELHRARNFKPWMSKGLYFGAAMVGLLIGQFYDGTARPFALALLICSTLALGFVHYSERGVLFRRLNVKPPKERIIP